MIHYGLQYQKLVEVLAISAARAKCVEFEAGRAMDFAQKAMNEKAILLNDARRELEVSTGKLNEALAATPYDAVEKYHTETGAYPI